MTERSLFDRVVAASGLTPVVAPFTIRRLLLRADVVPPEALTAPELRRALPELLGELGAYLGPAEYEAAAAALEALVS